jgi:hypothetical protein
MTVHIRVADPDDAVPLLALRRKLFAETNTMLWEPQEFVATAGDEHMRIKQLTSAKNCTYFATARHSLLG